MAYLARSVQSWNDLFQKKRGNSKEEKGEKEEEEVEEGTPMFSVNEYFVELNAPKIGLELNWSENLMIHTFLLNRIASNGFKLDTFLIHFYEWILNHILPKQNLIVQ